MSNYHPMWAKIKELAVDELDDWIRTVQPARGQSIDFRGIRVLDVDLLEALRSFREFG